MFAAGFYLMSSRARENDPLIYGVSPASNPDGTIDYTIINRRLERRGGKFYPVEGAYWVLRLPKQYPVIVSKDETLSFFPDYTSSKSIDFQRRKNESVAFSYSWPTLRPPPPGPEESAFLPNPIKGQISSINRVSVFLENSYVPAGKGLSNFKMSEDETCRSLGIKSNGVEIFQEADKNLGTNSKKPGICTRLFSYSPQHFVVRNDIGLPIASGKCIGSCSADLVVLDHKVHIGFSRRLLDEVPAIVTETAKFIEKITVRQDKISWIK